MELRAQLGQAEVNRQQLLAQNEKLVVEKQELELVNEELRNDVEVAENDRTVLKDSLVEVESERTKLTLDLGQLSQQKMVVEGQILQLEQKVEEVRREAQHEVTEAEMSSAALQGELSALREEVEAGEQQFVEPNAGEEKKEEKMQIQQLDKYLNFRIVTFETNMRII